MKLTEARARALYRANKDLWLRFTGYHKYVFSFAGENDKLSVVGQLGGDANDIYREQISGDAFRPSWDGESTFAWVTDLRYWGYLKVTDKTTGVFWERPWDA